MYVFDVSKKMEKTQKHKIIKTLKIEQICIQMLLLNSRKCYS